MASSRLRRLEDRREKRRIILAISGTLVVLGFLGFFGLGILEGFSLLLDKLRGATPQQQTQSSLILPPTLDAPVEATNSATITVTGRGEPERTLILYVNDAEFKKLPVPADGSISVDNVPLAEGSNTISAKLTDGKDLISSLSNVVTVAYKKGKPTLELTAPNDGAAIFGDKNSVTVSGKTEADNTVTVNNRFVVIRSDGSFDYTLTLQKGENSIVVVASDGAGNQTTIERKVTYTR